MKSAQFLNYEKLKHLCRVKFTNNNRSFEISPNYLPITILIRSGIGLHALAMKIKLNFFSSAWKKFEETERKMSEKRDFNENERFARLLQRKSMTETNVQSLKINDTFLLSSTLGY